MCWLNGAARTLGCVCVCVFFQISVFIFFKYIPRSGIAISYGNSIFSFLRNLYTVCHCESTDLHFHQQYRRVPFSPHPGQQLVVCTLCMMAILTGGRWQLPVVLIRSHWLKQCPDLTTQNGRCPALELLGLSPRSWGLGRTLRTIRNIPGEVKVVLDSLHFINVFIVQWTYLCWDELWRNGLLFSPVNLTLFDQPRHHHPYCLVSSLSFPQAQALCSTKPELTSHHKI